MHTLQNPILICDSVTHVDTRQSIYPIIVTGSHGGFAAAAFAIQKNVKGAIFNDAGIGKNQAGIAGLKLLDQYGIMSACVDTFTACIGIGTETMEGIISHTNFLADGAGVRPGQKTGEAARRMADAYWKPQVVKEIKPPVEKEIVILTQADGQRVVTLDSNSQIGSEHENAIVLTGSHGGLVGNLPAVKHSVLAAFYNDAGIGKNSAGISRLPWLHEHGIIGATVSANSARIGIGFDTYQNGIISFVNQLGQSFGIKQGMTAKKATLLVLEYSIN